MLEVLYAFSVFLIIAALIPLSLNTAMKHAQVDARTHLLEWNVFVEQLKKEIRASQSANVSQERIILMSYGQAIMYEKYNGRLRRRVDSTGHEIVLQNVDSVSFTSIQKGISIEVRDTFQQTHRALLYPIIDWEINHGP